MNQIVTLVVQDPNHYSGVVAVTGPTLLEAMDQFVKHMMHTMRNEVKREPLQWCLDHYDNIPYTFEEFKEKVDLFYQCPTPVVYFVNNY